MPDKDRPGKKPESSEPEHPGPGKLYIRDFGHEVHLWVEQRVSWKIALQILEILKGRDPSANDDKP